jgi:deoxycytidine triphosphate deaminase
MAVLGHSVLRPRLTQIFSPGTFTYDKVSEASYDLRIAADGLLFRGHWYPVGGPPVRDIRIGAGEIALLSTQEQFRMPDDLVGIVNIKFKSGALRGLTLVFGSRVDPGYGRDVRIAPPDPYMGQRLYLVVYNISTEEIYLRPGESLFMVEFHSIDGQPMLEKRDNNDTYMATQIGSIVRFGFLAGVGSRVAELEKKVVGLEGIERRVNLVVVGVAALVAATLLGVVLNFATSFMGSRPAGPPPAGAGARGSAHEGTRRGLEPKQVRSDGCGRGECGLGSWGRHYREGQEYDWV